MSKSAKFLIKQDKSLIYTNSLELAEYLDVEHNKLFNAITRINNELKSMGVSNSYSIPLFILQDYIHPQNNQKYKVYFITLGGITYFFMNYTPRKRKDGNTYVKDQYKKSRNRFIRVFTQIQEKYNRLVKQRRGLKWTRNVDEDTQWDSIEIQKNFQSGYILNTFKVYYSDLNKSLYDGLLNDKYFKKRDATPKQINLIMEAQKNVIRDSKFIEVDTKDEGKELIRAEGRLVKCWNEGNRRGIMKCTEIVINKMTKKPRRRIKKEELLKPWN